MRDDRVGIHAVNNGILLDQFSAAALGLALANRWLFFQVDGRMRPSGKGTYAVAEARRTGQLP